MNFENGKGHLNITPFGELETARSTGRDGFKPTWGASIRRYDITTTGSGAAIAETGGEIRMQSGTATSNVVILQTKRRGQYVSGSQCKVGLGIRIPEDPTGTQDILWGYYDSQNGFHFGKDATGTYVAYVKDGTTTRVYQSNWNIDTLDGDGPSGLTLDLIKGYITGISFVWYGYGPIEYYFNMAVTGLSVIKKIVVHRIKFDNQVSITDPNQPLRFEVRNGASSSTDISLYVGGHQVELIGGDIAPVTRKNAELLTNYTTATDTNWQPIIAIRKKATFNDRSNSVNVRITSYLVAGDGEMETRLTWGATTSNLSWGAPTGVTAGETAVETKVTGGTALTTSADGEPFDYGYIDGSNRADGVINTDLVSSLGSTDQVVLWIRRLSASGAIVIKHAHLEILEQW